MDNIAPCFRMVLATQDGARLPITFDQSTIWEPERGIWGKSEVTENQNHLLFFPEHGLSWWLRWCRICLRYVRPGLIPGSGRFPGEGNGYPLRYPCMYSTYQFKVVLELWPIQKTLFNLQVTWGSHAPLIQTTKSLDQPLYCVVTSCIQKHGYQPSPTKVVLLHQGACYSRSFWSSYTTSYTTTACCISINWTAQAHLDSYWVNQQRSRLTPPYSTPRPCWGSLKLKGFPESLATNVSLLGKEK